jgi:dolichol-phosphate mannosyltransferase|tara:strand:+ start:1568 stop:1789 length:222 start_codon:yes stop_codon:yes gene_type:complete
MKVSIVVPLYYEERTIINILLKIQDEIKKLNEFNFEVIIINDGSNNNSKKLLKENSSLYNILISLKIFVTIFY